MVNQVEGNFGDEVLEAGDPAEVSDGILNDSSRARFLRMISGIAVGGILAGLGVSCSKEKPKRSVEDPKVVTERAVPVKSSRPTFKMDPRYKIDVDESDSIDLPRCTVFKKYPIDIQTPCGAELPREEFIAAMKTAVERIKTSVGPKFIEDFKRTKGRGREWDISVLKAMRSMFGIISQAHPAFEPIVTRTWDNLSETSTSMKGLVSFLNEFLAPVGYYFFLAAGTEWESDFFEISGTDLVGVDFGRGRSDESSGKTAMPHAIPVLHLNSAFLKKNLNKSFTGTCSDDFRFALVVDDERDGSVKRLQDLISDIPEVGRKVDINKLKEDFDKTSAVHEAAHVAIVRMFPSLPVFSTEQRFDFKIGINLGGTQFSLPFELMPAINFHELCANGIALSQTDFDTPHNIIRLLNDLNRLPQGYRALAALLPIVILEAAPDSELKQDVMKRFVESGGKGFNLDYLELVMDESFTVEHTRRVGEILFKLGVSLMRKAERGELKTTHVPAETRAYNF